MQPPIRLGTVLQNRYCLIKVLGQGGMARTYLAKDQGRFNELCALKELIPAQTENYFLEKSRQLFQREATILYQIQHPQVPQFRATFEQDLRLFLVQDYVEGKTYRTLLNERKVAGTTFTQAEVLHLLQQLLPVLAHLHSRGIIHRDITPDNIILRESDAKPVLIDFGVVKELATRLQSVNTTITTVGKWGYAPSEQMQTGKAYPSSDLYALAVTAVVLLTGREPQELLDNTQLSWNWQSWATVSPEVGRMLNQMLSYQPGDRYQSVVEVARVLQPLNHKNHPLAGSRRESPPSPQSRQQIAPESRQLQTATVGRRSDLTQSSTNKTQRLEAVSARPSREWATPWMFLFMGTIVALFSGVGSWMLVSSILAKQQRPVPLTFPSPIISGRSTPTPTTSDIPSAEPSNYKQHLNLVAGVATSVENTVKTNEPINYTFNGKKGQQLTATFAGEGILLTVLGPNQELIDDAERVRRYQGTLPFTGNYTVRLSPVWGASQSKYKLNLLLENPLEPMPTSTLNPTVTPTPTFDVQAIFNGRMPMQVSGQTKPQQIKRYLLNVQEGQQVSVAVEEGSVTLNIRHPDGQLGENDSKLLNWQKQVQSSGEYQIDVLAIQDQPSDFTLSVSIRD